MFVVLFSFIVSRTNYLTYGFVDRATKTVIVMPLQALIQQQLSKLRSAGYNVCEVSNNANAASAVKDDVTHLFMTPEAMADYFIPTAKSLTLSTISHVFVDESHCVAKW